MNGSTFELGGKTFVVYCIFGSNVTCMSKCFAIYYLFQQHSSAWTFMDLCVVSFITSSHFDVDIKQDPKPVVKYYSFRVDFVMG